MLEISTSVLMLRSIFELTVEYAFRGSNHKTPLHQDWVVLLPQKVAWSRHFRETPYVSHKSWKLTAFRYVVSKCSIQLWKIEPQVAPSYRTCDNGVEGTIADQVTDNCPILGSSHSDVGYALVVRLPQRGKHLWHQSWGSIRADLLYPL